MVRYADTGDKYSRLQSIIQNANKILDYRLDGDQEQALIITDTEVSPMLYHTVAGTLRSRGVEPTIPIIPQLGAPNQEPPDPVAEGVQVTDVIINMCTYPITHTERSNTRTSNWASLHPAGEPDRRLLLAGNDGCRPQEGRPLHRAGGNLPPATRVSSRDLAVGHRRRTESRRARPGHVRFPLGETPTCPVEESVNGTIVHDSFMMGVGMLDDPITWEVENGQIQEIKGGREAQKLRQFVEKHGDENSHWIGEFSVMTHPTARPNDNYIEHKEVEGGVHFAMGDGLDLGTPTATGFPRCRADRTSRTCQSRSSNPSIPSR